MIKNHSTLAIPFLHYTLYVYCNKDIDLVDNVIIQNQFKLMEKSKVKQHGKKIGTIENIL